MWDIFFLCLGFGVVVLTIPGYLFLRAFGRDRVTSLAASPVLSLFSFPLLCMICEKIGVSCSWQVLFLPLLCFSLVAFVASRVAHVVRSGSSAAVGSVSGWKEWGLFCLYCCAGIASVLFVFVWNLDGADSFVQEYDNVHHLAAIQTFASSGDWSSLSSAFYPEDQSSIDPIPSSGFYPSAWHEVAALMVNALGANVAVSANASNSLFVMCVFSFGVFLLMRSLFPRQLGVRACGAVCSFAFAAFPWKILAWGPIFPNLASFCLTPIVIWAFMSIVEEGISTASRAFKTVYFVFGVVALAFLQPNAVFTTAVFLIPFCIYRLICFADSTTARRKMTAPWKMRMLLVGMFAVVVVVAWYVAFNHPMMSSMVDFSWPVFAGKAQAVVNALLLSFRETSAQVVLGAFVVVGALLAIRGRSLVWLVATHVLMCFMYILSASTDGDAKQILTGFWYTDCMRLAANAVLSAIPLASWGFYSVCNWAGKRLAAWMSCGKAGDKGNAVSVLAVVAIAAAMIFFPSFTVEGTGRVSTAFGSVRSFIEQAYSTSRLNVLDDDERSFVEEVKRVVPEGSVIVNEPNDGSAFAYGLYGLNIYYRSMDGYGGDGETEESRSIRQNLDRAASDPGVRQSLNEIGAEYLLQLDQGDWELESRYLFSYYVDQWTGIDSVTDETPGFEVVLSEGDMRLYRITALD